MPKLKQMSAVGIRLEMAIQDIHRLRRWAEALQEAGEQIPDCFMSGMRDADDELCEAATAAADHLGFAIGPK